MTTRRRFLKTGAVLALAAGIPLKLSNIAFGQRAAHIDASQPGAFELRLRASSIPSSI